MRTYLLIVGLLLSTVLSAQTTEDCYREFRSIGITYLNNKEFANAFSAFVSAIRCPELPEDDDIDLWFKRVVDAEKAFYEQLIEEAKVSERAAVVAQKEAEEAQERERKARLQAELNAEEAKRRGRRAESLRLSLLAENELQKGNREDALLLSFLAMQLNDQDSVFSQMRIFSEVVKDSFSRVVYTSKEPIQSISSLQSGKEILVTDRTEICLLTLDGQQKEKIWPRSLQRIIGISSMTDGRSSIVYSDNFEAALISDGKHFTMLELPHEAPIISATLDKSNNYILTCARDRQAKLWGIKDKTEVTLAGHLGNVYQGGFSPDGSTIFTRSSDGTIKLWNREGANKGTLSGVYFYDATFAPDQEELVAASAVGDILITDLDGKIKRTLDGHSKPVHSVVFSSDGQYLLSSSSAEVLIWQLPDYQKVASIDHDQEIVGGCLLADDSGILSWSVDGSIKRWDLTGQLVADFQGHQRQIIEITPLVEKGLLLSSSIDGACRLWDLNGDLLLEWSGNQEQPLPAFFVNNNEDVLIIGNDGQSIITCPLPQVIYGQLKNEEIENTFSLKVKRLIEKYDLEFISTD